VTLIQLRCAGPNGFSVETASGVSVAVGERFLTCAQSGIDAQAVCIGVGPGRLPTALLVLVASSHLL